MTAITSYATLLTALGEWNNRSDLASQYPGFISLAEAHFNRELRVPDMEVTATFEASTASVELPGDFLSARAIYVDATTDVVLGPLTAWALRAAYPTAATGTPAAYAIRGGDMTLAPAPSSATTLVMDYYASLDGLSTSNETNWLIEAHPDIYLRAVKYYSLEFLKDYDAADRELMFVNGLIESLNRHGNRKRVSANPLAMKPLVRE